MIRTRLHFSTALMGGLMSAVLILLNFIPPFGRRDGMGFPFVMVVFGNGGGLRRRRKGSVDDLKDAWRILNGNVYLFPNAVILNSLLCIAAVTLLIIAIEYTIRVRAGKLAPVLGKQPRKF